MDEYHERMREQSQRSFDRAQRAYENMEDPRLVDECPVEDCAECDLKQECDSSEWVDPESLCSTCKEALEDCECVGKIAEKGEDENA